MPYCKETLSPYGLWVSMVSVTPMEIRLCACTARVPHKMQVTAVRVAKNRRVVIMMTLQNRHVQTIDAKSFTAAAWLVKAETCALQVGYSPLTEVNLRY